MFDLKPGIKKQIIIITFTVLLITIIFSGCNEEEKKSKTIYVDDSGGEDYTSIQSAINAAVSGDTIYVYSGTYEENIVINKTITLIGENNVNTIINGSDYGYVLNISANHVSISSFTIQNSRFYSCGIYINSNYNSITNTILSNNVDGLYLSYSSDNVISGNTIIDNLGDGINFQISSNNAIYGNKIENNYGIGINFYYSSNNTISDNTISNNAEEGVNFQISSNNTISNNTISNNDFTGIGLDYYFTSYSTAIPVYTSSNNIIFSNNIINNNETGIYISKLSSNNTIYCNNLIKNAPNAKATENNTWYNTTLKEGNYWDDYNGTDVDGDGIGDVPYNVSDGDNQDLYPLIYPAEI